VLELEGEHIARLGDEDLRLLVVKLCEAELRRAAQPSSAVLAGGNQTAKDGGIDVRVELAAKSDALDFIPRPNTGFQVKCEDMPAGEIAKEMLPDGVLRESIKELIARNGAYVIVSSKGTVADAFLAKRLEAMRNAIAGQPGAAGLKVDFYDRDRLARWVRQYPGVEMWLRGCVNARLQGWQGYAAWAGGQLDEPYLLDDTARLVERTGGGTATALSVGGGIDRLRSSLGKPGQVLRLVGLSGTGKTRLVQALFESGVGTEEPLDQALALYTDLGHSPEPSAREMLLHLGAMEQRAIVVVDNCNPTTHRTLAEVVRQHLKHLSLLTVEYDVADEDAPEATDIFELAPASDQVLDRILGRLAPHLTGPDRHRITEFAGGNARIALALARTVAQGETLGVLNDAELFRRLFRQGQADDQELLRAAEVCSLVYSFEGEDTKSDASDLRVLASLAGTSPRELYRHIDTLRRRDIVQSRSKWRALLPPALANRLAKSALQSIPRSDIVDAFAPSERLLESFSRRLEYLHDSEEARSIASRWMDDELWLAKPAALNSLGRKLFFNLAPLVPQKVLTSMELALDPSQAPDFMLRQKGSLREWSTLLRHLAYEPQAFDRAASLLLTLAEFEEGDAGDSSGAWKEMFRIGLSGTLAPPVQRVQLLERLLASTTGKRLELAWDAIEAMLEANHISSSHDFSFGARPHGYGWEPSSGKEVQAWFESAFSLVRQMAGFSAGGRERSRAAVAAHFRELWACGVNPQLSALTRELAGESGWPAGWVAVRSALRFDGDEMPPEVLSALRGLEATLAPRGLLQEVRTYTVGHASGLLDVSDSLDESDEAEDKNPVSSWERVNDKVIALGAAVAHDEAVLHQVLPELLAEQSGRQHFFGFGLGQGATDARRQWKLLYDAFAAAAGEPNVAVLAGFVQGLRTNDSAAVARILDSLAGDPKLAPYFPTILGVPKDDSDGDRLVAAMQRAVAKPQRFLLRTNHDGSGGLSVPKFCEAMDVLSRMEGGLIPAIDELGTELHHWKARGIPHPPELMLLGRRLLSQFNFDTRNHNVAWRVNELAKLSFVGPDAADAAAQFARRFATALDDYRTHGDEYGDLACTLFKLQPTIALDAFLSKPTKKRHFGFRSRFVARHGPVVQCATEDVILDWVRIAPEARAPLVASEINIIDSKDGLGMTFSSLATRLLELSSEKSPILEAFSTNFHPTHWSGSLAQTLAPFVALLEGLAGYPDPVVTTWAQEGLKKMRARIERDWTLDIMKEQSFE